MGCHQKSARLSVYEAQILTYMATFHIPEDYQQRILEDHGKLQAAYSDTEGQRRKLEVQLKRVKELYVWGDYIRSEYEARKDLILAQMEQLEPHGLEVQHLDKFAQFLGDVPAAWEAATQEQRNKLARTLFDQVWLKDKAVVAVKPRPELEPFFKLNYEEFTAENIEGGVSRNHEGDPSTSSGWAVLFPPMLRPFVPIPTSPDNGTCRGEESQSPGAQAELSPVATPPHHHHAPMGPASNKRPQCAQEPRPEDDANGHVGEDVLHRVGEGEGLGKKGQQDGRPGHEQPHQQADAHRPAWGSPGDPAANEPTDEGADGPGYEVDDGYHHQQDAYPEAYQRAFKH